MGSCPPDTAPAPRTATNTPAYKMMFVKAALVCCLALAPSVFSFTLPQTQSAVAVRRSEVGRQFSDDDLINYGIWGFIAGLTDYFIRMGLTPAPTTTTTTASTFRKHNKHKNKKNKKDRKRNKKNKNKIDHKTVEVEEEETMEKEESMDVEPFEDVVAEDAVVAETVEA